MQTGLDTIRNEFRTSSSRLFFSLYSDFEKAVAPLNRKRDENVFQQLQGRYSSDLEKQLNDIAKRILERYRDMQNINLIRGELTNSIAQYVHEFIAKAKSL